MKGFRPAGNYADQYQVHPTKFESKELFLGYAEQHGLVALVEGFAKWEHLLSPKQYSIVEVRTVHGMRQAMLLPKETLKAAWETDPFRKMLCTGDAAPVQRKRRHHSAKQPALR
jgi:hypothetical protein